MMHINAVFVEKVLKGLNACIWLVSLSVNFQSSFGVCFIKVSLDVLLWQFLQVVQNFLIRSSQHKHFIRNGSWVYYFGCVFCVFFLTLCWGLYHHKDILSVVVCPGIAIQNIASVETVILTQSPFKAFVEQLVI